MNVRFSSCIGTEVLDEATDETAGLVSGILIHPDTGRIEGFFVRPQHASHEEHFLSSVDILRWGMHVAIRHADMIGPVEDNIRLESLLKDSRRVLGQAIRTDRGRRLGTCADVQFNTETMRIEWLFPRKWWRWNMPLPITDVLEIRPEAIVVRDVQVAEPQESSAPGPAEVLEALKEISPAPERVVKSRTSARKRI